MPHIIVKLWPGRSEEQKKALAEKIVQDAMATLKCSEKSLSVAFEEVPQEEWAERVFKPDIANRKDAIYKQPGYGLDDL